MTAIETTTLRFDATRHDNPLVRIHDGYENIVRTNHENPYGDVAYAALDNAIAVLGDMVWAEGEMFDIGPGEKDHDEMVTCINDLRLACHTIASYMWSLTETDGRPYAHDYFALVTASHNQIIVWLAQLLVHQIPAEMLPEYAEETLQIPVL